jgi:hypothetical protein
MLWEGRMRFLLPRLGLATLGVLTGACTLIHTRGDFVGGSEAEGPERRQSGAVEEPDASFVLEEDAAPTTNDDDASVASCAFRDPVYRLQSNTEGAVALYTASLSEISARTDGAVASHTNRGAVFLAGWWNGGTDADNAAPPASLPAGTVPAYRLHNPRNDDRLYTTNAYERDVVKREGWADEGVAFYVVAAKNGPAGVNVPATETGCLVPIEGFVRKDAGYHGLAATDEDRKMYRDAGWESEGIRFYASPR